MMGIFYMLMMLMHIFSKRFSAAGLRDVLIQSGVVAEGSVDKTLSRKMYSRVIRLYKLAYDAITRKVFDVIVSTKEDDGWVQSNLNDINFATFWEHEISQTMHNKFLDAREKLKAGEPLHKFWMSFLKMIELLLNTIYAVRAVNRELLLECIRNILPYTFACDNIFAKVSLVAQIQSLNMISVFTFPLGPLP